MSAVTKLFLVVGMIEHAGLTVYGATHLESAGVITLPAILTIVQGIYLIVGELE